MSPVRSKTVATMEYVRQWKTSKDKGQTEVKAEADTQVGTTHLDIMLKNMAEITLDYDHLKSTIGTSKESCKNIMKEITSVESSISKLEQELGELTKDYGTLQDNYGETHEQYLKIVSQAKKMNLLLDGMFEEKDETEEQCLAKVYEVIEKYLQMPNAKNIQIVQCFRMDPDDKDPDNAFQVPTNPLISRSIMCTFQWFSDRLNIWVNRGRLQNTGLWLREDYPSEVMQRRYKLLPIVKEARRLNLDARLRDDSLILDSKKYNIHTLGQIPIELRKSSTKLNEIISSTISNGDSNNKNDDIIDINLSDAVVQRRNSDVDKIMVFYGASCPFSTFYPAKFRDEYGYIFSSSQQYFEYRKAVFAGDDISAHKIRKATSPKQCKQIGDRLRLNHGVWDKLATDIMYKGCVLKFSQNLNLKQCLLDTEDAVLAEAGYDKLWGIGLGMESPNVTKRGKWKGQNLLGDVLMRVRSVLRGK